MSDRLGYVVIEFNQASGQPRVVGDLYSHSSDATWEATGLLRDVRQNGRLERFAIGEVRLSEYVDPPVPALPHREDAK